MEDSFENIRFIALKILVGEELDAVDEVEFYDYNKIEIDRLVKDYTDDEFSIDILDFEDE